MVGFLANRLNKIADFTANYLKYRFKNTIRGNHKKNVLAQMNELENKILHAKPDEIFKNIQGGYVRINNITSYVAQTKAGVYIYALCEPRPIITRRFQKLEDALTIYSSYLDKISEIKPTHDRFELLRESLVEVGKERHRKHIQEFLDKYDLNNEYYHPAGHFVDLFNEAFNAVPIIKYKRIIECAKVRSELMNIDENISKYTQNKI